MPTFMVVNGLAVPVNAWVVKNGVAIPLDDPAPAGGNHAYIDAVLADTPVHLFSGGTGTELTNMADATAHGLLNGSPTRTTLPSGLEAITYAGVGFDEYANLPIAAFGASVGSSTVEMVVKTAETGTPSVFGIEGTGDKFRVVWNQDRDGAATTGSIRAIITAGTVPRAGFIPAGGIGDNLEHHLAVTYNGAGGGGLELYWDGVAVVGSSLGGASTHQAWSHGPGLATHSNAGVFNATRWAGTIGPVSLYNTVLTATQIQAHYNALSA